MEDIKQEQRNETNDSDAVVDALIDYSENYVSKAEVNEIIAEKDAKIAKLVQAVKKGSTLKEPEVIEKPSITELANKLVNQKNFNNLEGWDLAMQYRQACIDAGMRDPMLPTARGYQYTQQAQDEANRECDVINDLISGSEGNPKAFNMMAENLIK